MFPVLRRIRQLEKKLVITGSRLPLVREVLSRFSTKLSSAEGFLKKAATTVQETEDKNRASTIKVHRNEVIYIESHWVLTVCLYLRASCLSTYIWDKSLQTFLPAKRECVCMLQVLSSLTVFQTNLINKKDMSLVCYISYTALSNCSAEMWLMSVTPGENQEQKHKTLCGSFGLLGRGPLLGGEAMLQCST